VFYRIVGKRRSSGDIVTVAIVFEHQLANALTGLLKRDDVKLVEVQDASEREWLQYQRSKQKEGRDE
jgi:hypothetical protein